MIVRLLVLTAVFASGAALMSLEMAGFRRVQPEFGSDIMVWGSLISVFLGGLALGASLGGRLADRRPAFWKLGCIFLAAGAVAAVIPLYADAVFEWTFPGKDAPPPEAWAADTSGDFGGLQVSLPPAQVDLRLPTLAAGAALFLVPSILIGMITPYAAKLLIHRLGRLGAGVGNVSAVSTAGAIAGTLGTAFFLITWMGTRWLLATSGIVLAAFGVLLVAVQALARPADEPPDAAPPATAPENHTG